MIRGLDHVNIRVRNLQATLRFYRNVLDMRPNSPPGMAAGDSEAWLCDEQGHAVLHVGTADLGAATGVTNATADRGSGSGSGSGSGAIHHLAFDCVDYLTALERIRRNGIEVRCNDIAAARLRQLFVLDPDEILIELNFRS